MRLWGNNISSGRYTECIRLEATSEAINIRDGGSNSICQFCVGESCQSLSHPECHVPNIIEQQKATDERDEGR